MALKFPDILEHNNPANPLVDITELRGNSYPIGELNETGSIPSNKRNLGAIVFASSSQEFYGFYGATTESADWNDTANWRTLSTFTGSYSGSFSGSFSGSYVGDGSQLTGIDAAINSYTNAANNRIVTSVDASSVNAEANLTFDGSTLTVTGATSITGDTTLNGATIINGDEIILTNVDTGTDNTVLVLNEENNIVTDEIDPRVWGTTLLDGSLTSTRIPYASDSNTLTDDAGLTFDGTTLVANAATITNGLLVSGDLTVVGTASFQHTDSLQVADRFILLASGSNSTGMGGLVVQQATQDIGEVFSWDNTTSRWATTGSFNASSNTFTPEAFMASVIDIDNGGEDIAKYQKNGNIRVESGEIYIYS